MHFFKVFLLIGLSTLPFSRGGAQSNEGTLFWCGFMEHRDVSNNSMVVMITSKKSTQGTVSIPGLGWNSFFNVSPNGVSLIDLPASAETMGSEEINRNGILVESDDPVSIYIHQYANLRSEASLVLPIEATGREYFIMAYQGVRQQNVDYPSSFLVVAQEDKTEITIELSANTLGGKAANSSFQIQLDAGQTYQVQGAFASEDLTGTYLKGDKPFAVFGGAKWSQVPSSCGARDNLLEQMYPVGTFGKTFAAVPNANMAFDVYRILASQNNTNVVVNNGFSAQTYLLNRGEWVEYSSAGAQIITADKPIQMAQYIIGQFCNGHFVGDPSMMLLNSIEQTKDTVTLFNSSLENITENYLNVVARTEDVPFIFLDGSLMLDQGALFRTFPGNPDYSYTAHAVSAGAHTLVSQGCGIIVNAYGYGEAESYAYSGGASFRAINSVPIPDGACLTDTLVFNSQLSSARFEVDWDFGDGNTASGIRVAHKYQSVGTYNVKANIRDLCLNLESDANKDIEISLKQALEVGPDQVLCEGTDLLLEAREVLGATYLWTGPDNFRSRQQFPIFSEVTQNQTGTYTAIGIVEGCETFPAFTQVQINPNPMPDLGSDKIVCDEEEGFMEELSPGDFATYNWQDGSRTSTLQTIKSGLFWVEVSNEFNCIGLDTVLLEQKCQTRLYIPNIFSPNGDAINDRFGILGNDIEKIHLFIYDRWGNLVFESQELRNTWDGTLAGSPLPVGVYMWKAEIQGRRRNGEDYVSIETGTITLVR